MIGLSSENKIVLHLPQNNIIFVCSQYTQTSNMFAITISLSYSKIILKKLTQRLYFCFVNIRQNSA
jgi:hypothetical protein